ncbi:MULTISPECIES: AAA family ATPase [Streptomyces]|uniref:AAA family ATPase n=1 Tax=Streptomyces ramulosus TaxID=47762 RepID=A0ABW1FFZ0_9ACTN
MPETRGTAPPRLVPGPRPPREPHAAHGPRRGPHPDGAPGPAEGCAPAPGEACAPAAGGAASPAAPAVTDLRARPAAALPAELRFPAGAVVVVSGLPGGGKSTLMHRVVPVADDGGAPVHRVDSQDVRERWERGRLRRVPYALYRPLVRVAHYLGLRRVLRSGRGAVVHDCGTQRWVRRWIARGGRRPHLLLLDVPPEVARCGQRSRGRGVSGYAFARHRAATRRLIGDAAAGRPPRGFASAVLLDRAAADRLRALRFDGGGPAPRAADAAPPPLV